jgi:hypothetical protein
MNISEEGEESRGADSQGNGNSNNLASATDRKSEKV